MSDTDSLIIKMKSPDLELEFDKLENFMVIISYTSFKIQDYSNYSVNHPRYDTSRMNRPGYFKSETKGETLTHFIGLKSKNYTYKTTNASDTVKCKGVKARHVQSNINFQHFRNILKTTTEMKMSTFKNLRASNHRMYVCEFTKCALNAFDSKRYILNCGVHSRSHYHYRNSQARNNYCNKCSVNKLLVFICL